VSYTDEEIACVVHEANRGLQMVQGDPAPSQPWPVESPEIRQSAVDGVRQARAGRTPRQLHQDWCGQKEAAGWQYGPVKDPVAKTHPCLVAYADLPDHQKLKDELFLAVVAVMASTTAMRPVRTVTTGP
jgi:hypothetical protein